MASSINYYQESISFKRLVTELLRSVAVEIKHFSTEVFTSLLQINVSGINLNSNAKVRDAQKLISYMPQNEPLQEDLTVEEHLTYFATLRGLVVSHLLSVCHHRDDIFCLCATIETTSFVCVPP